jgi:hypothetical protein
LNTQQQNVWVLEVTGFQKSISHMINFFALSLNKGFNISNNFRNSWASKIGILEAPL